MERQLDQGGLVELGTASTDTLGTTVISRPEDNGFYGLGLSDE